MSTISLNCYPGVKNRGTLVSLDTHPNSKTQWIHLICTLLLHSTICQACTLRIPLLNNSPLTSLSQISPLIRSTLSTSKLLLSLAPKTTHLSRNPLRAMLPQTALPKSKIRNHPRRALQISALIINHTSSLFVTRSIQLSIFRVLRFDLCPIIASPHRAFQ